MRGHPTSTASDSPAPARFRRRLDGRDFREIERAMARLGVAGVYAIEMHGVKVIFHNHRAAPEAKEIPAQVPPQPAEAQAAPPQPSGRLQKRKARSALRATRRRERLQQQQVQMQHPPGLQQPGDLHPQAQLIPQRQVPQPEQDEMQQPAQDMVPPAQDEMEKERAAKRGQPSTPSQEDGMPSPAAPSAKRTLVLPGPPPPSLPPSPPSPSVTDGLVATGHVVRMRDASSVKAKAPVHKPKRPNRCICCGVTYERAYDLYDWKDQWCYDCHQENCGDNWCDLCSDF